MKTNNDSFFAEPVDPKQEARLLALEVVCRLLVWMAEAASLDGASSWQTFIHITLPQIRPEIFVVVLVTTIATLKVFGQVFVLTRGGPGTSTLVPSYYVYENFFQKANVGYGSAIATIMATIIIILAAVFISVQSRRDLTEDF